MQSRGKKLLKWWRRWCDEWRLALSGVVLATRQRSFLLAFALSFVIFGTLMSLLSSSTAPLAAFWSNNLPGKLRILGQGLLDIFIVNGDFWSWLLNFLIILCQSILIGLVALVWQKRRRSRKAQVVATATNVNNVEYASVAAGLAVLGSGCPTCGTTLLGPMLCTIFSTSGLPLAYAISGILTAIALVVSLLSIKKLGNDAYAHIVSEKFQRRHQARQAETQSAAQSAAQSVVKSAVQPEKSKTTKE